MARTTPRTKVPEQEYLDEIFSKPAISQSDAAWVLKVSRQRVGQLVSQGRIATISDSKENLLDSRSLLEFILKRRTRLLRQLEEMRLPSMING